LGLTICQGLLRLMSSSLDVVSEFGRGSTFSFTLSLPTSEVTNEAGVVLPALLGQGLVVIVSGSQPFAESVADLFRFFRYTCVICPSNSEAIALLRERQRVFLVLVDFETISGDDLLTEVNKKNSEVVVDVLAGVGGKKMKRRLAGLREKSLLDGHMTLPLNIGQIQKFLNHLSHVEAKPEDQSFLYDVSILIITPDPVIANVEKNLLRSFGKEVDTCNSVADGLELLKKKYYHIAFLSAHIGDVSGFQGALKMRQLPDNRNPQIILVGIITDSSRRTVLACIECGMDDFVL